ncbi:MAG: CheR family methyltransferase [Chitinophagaceae bacterium]
MKKTPGAKKTVKRPTDGSRTRKITTKIPENFSEVQAQFPVVGIGASAGGLEAVSELLKNVPLSTGMAFLYVQHLSPEHESLLSSILPKVSKIPVQEAVNGMIIRPDTLIVIPAKKEMTIRDGKILLSPRLQKNKVNVLIDVFFTSLAEEFQEKAFGVILSGNATDGTHGLEVIKSSGGITFAQDDSAKFTSMPHSAISAGVVDFVLSPSEIAHELIRMSHHPFVTGGAVAKDFGADDIDSNSPELKSILQLLQHTFGVNFNLYKLSTIKRRVLRRMLLSRIKSLKAYQLWLKDKSAELDLLFNDLLINVTNFFRDADACKYLKASLLPKILKGKKAGESLRIWVAACSSGEEAYSIAMILLEIKASLQLKNINLQIFATDLSQQAINKARVGVYTKQQVEHVSAARLQRFFTKYDGGYRIAQNVRDLCVFAPHNILSDPPFSRIDFISCCNLLIYFDSVAQKKVLATFHYALNPEGYLLLGQSETTATTPQLFTVVEKKVKVYTRKKNSGPGLLPPPDYRYRNPRNLTDEISDSKKKLFKSPASTTSLDAAINSLLLTKYVPPGVVINQQMEIMQFRGNTTQYLHHQEGKATLNILKMSRPDIAFELRSVIEKAFKSGKAVSKKNIVLNNGTMLSLEAVPVNTAKEEAAILVLFTKVEAAEIPSEKGKSKKVIPASESRVLRLEEEVALYREDLLSMGHNHEVAMEELQSANEEVLSSNEELRSINEELETSKEEIQSANEELATFNQELQTRNELLDESYRYSEAIIATIHDPMVVLDNEMRIKTANRSFYQRFYMTEKEAEGISLFDIAGGKWNIAKLRKFLKGISQKNPGFKDLEIEQTFPRIGKVIMRVNAKRIVQPVHREQLLLLAIADVTELVEKQRAEKNELQQKITIQEELATASKLADEYIRSIFLQAPVPVVVFKGESFVVDLVNDKAVETFRLKQEDISGKPLLEKFPEFREAGVELVLQEVYRTGQSYSAEQFRVADKNLNGDGDVFFNFTLNAIRGLQGEVSSVIAVGIDVTQEVNARRAIEKQSSGFETAVRQRTRELNLANEELASTNNILKKVNKELASFAYVSSHDLQEPLRKIQLFVSKIQSSESRHLTETGKEYFAKVHDASVRMQRLIEDLLAFAQINTSEIKPEIADLEKITLQVVNEMSEVIAAKHATIKVSKLCFARIIPFQFQQLMQNLISNALKFVAPGRDPVITVEGKIAKGEDLGYTDLLADKKYCHIRVTDNGIGFEPEFSEQIFEVFQRLHGQQDYPGTGIGLAIAKKIVEFHKGIITASSELGKETRFDIYLPEE